jgi:hypothetical protein
MRMRTSALVIVVLFANRSLQSAEPKFLPWELLDDGWISLFDGETMFGWQTSGEAKWDVADREIRTDGAKAGWLMTTTEWADFELHVEFKAPYKTNSGVFLRTPLTPTNPAKDCYELNIAPCENPFPTASLVGRRRAKTSGDSFEYIKTPTVELATGRHVPVWDGEWHEFDITVIGPKISVQCDTVLVYEYEDEMPIRIGHIGLQSREGAVAFRNIRLRPVGLKLLLDGKDLAGWSTDRAEKCKFEVTKDGDLHITNGPGQIDTNADFANFVLRTKCKANGDGLNSGVFFRTLREGRWAGYESQIQNGFKNGDRTKPKDFGTGAIYRRQPARYVVPNDHEWFTKTIVVDGPHMAVWVNGYQVSDWTDTRPPKENAREGRRDGGGAIALQGHDATTDFLFRKIRAVELPR